MSDELKRVESGLRVVRITDGRERTSYLDKFDGHGATWIVADVRSKLAVQRRLLELKGFAEGLAVLRASELWTFAVRQLEPDLQIVSRELIQTSIAAKLRERNESWLHAPGAAKTAFEYIKQLLPVLASDVSYSFEEWFDHDENAASSERWKSWYLIARDVWNELKRDRLCASSWVPGRLAGVKDKLASVIGRELTIDLGAELSHIEADLLLELARSRRVTIFRPSPAWERDYPEGRLAVDWMMKEAPARGVAVTVDDALGVATELSPDRTNVGPEELVDRSSASVIYKRLPSATAEVKEAVARARLWLEAGISPAKIGIVAPDLESYWPVLSLHLETEGLPANKPVVSMLHSFSDVMRWLARLRIRTGVPASRDIEVDIFGESQPALSFVSFREIFSRVYEAADLELSRELQTHFENEFSDRGRWDSDERLRRDNFLAKALAVLRESDDPARAVRLFKTVLEECPPDLTFMASEWVKYLGDLAARIEVPVIAADPFGIACLNLSSLEGVDCTHVVIMGLHEGALRSQHGTALQTSDLRSIERTTGYVIDGEDRKRIEFESRWILTQPRTETHLLFADADLMGTVQTPSWSWISGAWSLKSATPEMSVALTTRFDEMQSREFGEVGSAIQRLRTERELGMAEQPHFGAGLIERLSATTIDQMSKCALRFAFDRLLGPRDEGVLDLDADRSRHGRLQHKIFEMLGERQWREHSDDELIELIEAARKAFETGKELEGEGARIVRTEQAWRSLRRRLVRVARWLLDFEREQRRRWPQLRTVATEAEFNGEIGSRKTPITGQIDRIDEISESPDAPKRLILIDYKNSSTSQNFSTWRTKNFWQPLVYAYAIEKGWVSSVEKDASALAGVFIYDVRDRSKGTGLRLRDGNENIFDFGPRSKGQTREDLDEAFGELESTIETVTEKLQTGAFLPVPADLKECLRCRWRASCRAPHLELI